MATNSSQADRSRRFFLQRGLAFGLGFAGVHALLAQRGSAALVEDVPAGGRALGAGFGPLRADPNKLVDLPRGFRYQIISKMGERMHDGLLVPGQPDGMAAFPGADGNTLIVCNHELHANRPERGAFGRDLALLASVPAAKLFDRGGGKRPSLGGTTTLVYSTRERTLVRQFLSLAGTNYNCAGGPTPWGSWLSCEEDGVQAGDDGAEQNHGWVFEVPARDTPELADPLPIRAMGRFRHEAVAIDPATGVVYMTEDRNDGLLYRYLPNQRTNLHAGGVLQALALVDVPQAWTHNQPVPRGAAGSAPAIAQGQKLRVRWVTLRDVESPKDDLREQGFAQGCARFARNEGMWWGQDGVYFCATTGGKAEKGQLWKLVPDAGGGADGGAGSGPDAGGVLELFVESSSGKLLENPDNITAAPWGDLVVCEDSVGNDQDPSNRLLGVTPAGEIYPIARNVRSESEFAGACFSPDGTTLFVNMQSNGITLAIDREDGRAWNAAG